MAKKRRTRSQKIIAQLRRELEAKKQSATSTKLETRIKSPIESKIIPEAYSPVLSTRHQIKKTAAKTRNININTSDQNLIKKDLLKTLYLSAFFFSLIGLFFWIFEAGGENIIRGTFHL